MIVPSNRKKETPKAAKFGKEFLSAGNSGAPDTEKVLSEYQSKWNITPEQYKDRVAMQLATEEKVAKLGQPAPDFQAEMLSAKVPGRAKCFACRRRGGRQSRSPLVLTPEPHIGPRPCAWTRSTGN
jgi:hypothetical protein